MIRPSIILLWVIACHIACSQDFDRAVITVDEVRLEAGEVSLLVRDSAIGATLSGEANQAAAVVLIRRTLAMMSLRSIGGKALDAIIDRELTRLDKDAHDRGRSLASIASARGVSLDGYRRNLAWQIAWSEYLKSRMTDAALKTYFHKHPNFYGQREYRVSQIFLKANGETSDESRTKNNPDVGERLTKVAEELRQAENVPDAFAKLARDISESGSADRGGEIGWVSHDGDLPHEVMSAIRKSATGIDAKPVILGPIESQLGYHLVLVSETRPGKTIWENLTDQSQLRQDYADALFADLVTRQSDARVQYLDSTLRPE